MFDGKTKITKHGLHQLSGDKEVVAAGLVISLDHVEHGLYVQPKAVFRVQLVDKHGNGLVEIANGSLSEGETLTMLRLDQPFNVEITGA